MKMTEFLPLKMYPFTLKTFWNSLDSSIAIHETIDFLANTQVCINKSSSFYLMSAHLQT